MSTKCFPAIGLVVLCAAALAVSDGFHTRAVAAPGLSNSGSAITRVKAKFEVGGDLRLPGDAKPSVLPMSVEAQFDYFERRIDDGSVDLERRSIRYYLGAEAAIKVDKQANRSTLSDERRLVRAAVSEDRTTIGSLHGHLTRQEQDLVDIPFNTLLLDKLLPAPAAGKGTTWKPADTIIAMLLGLDAVSSTDVQNVLTAVKDDVGEVAISGALNGAIGGVATEIELKGKLHYDIPHHQPFALVLLIKEKRSVGHVSPGLDVVARLELQIAPVAEAQQLSDAALGGIELATDASPPPLACRSADGGFSMLYEPRWRITREERDSVVMRLVDRGELVAQCNASVLPKLNGTEPITIETFQTEVQQSLGKHFGHFERAAENRTSGGLRMLNVVAMGAVEGLPITWNYYLLIDPKGRRAAVSFTMENALADRFGEADRLIIDEFRFHEPKNAAASPNAKSASRPRFP
jgi:hypothetical protein